MTHLSEADGAGVPLGGATLAAALRTRCEGLVAPSVRAADERSRQAGVLGALVVAALLAVLSAPLFWLGTSSIQASAAPVILAGFLLGIACALSASGRLDAVILASCGLAAAAIAVVAALSGGVGSLCLWMLALAPSQALSKGQRMAATVSGAFGFLALGAVALADWAGLARPMADLSGALDAVSIGVAALCGAFVIRRIAADRQANQSRRGDEAAERALADAALEEAVLLFSDEGALLKASGAASNLFAGSSPMSANRIVQAIHVTDRVHYLQAFAEIRNGADRLLLRARTAGEGGTFVEIEMDLRAHRDASRRLISVVAVARPVPISGEALAVLEQSLAAERESSLAKSRFLATVSHELRTPLNAIIGFSDVLDQEFFGGFQDPRQKEYVGHIRQSGEHLLGVVNGLLDVSKIEAGRYELSLETVSVVEICRLAEDTMRGELVRKGLAFDLALEPSLGRVIADRRACHQILLNLLSNAAKFTETGSVTLSAREVGDHLELAVRDTGIGIAAADLPRVGKPFVQLSTGTTRRYQGTGLGLSLVKGLADLHAGRMTIESEPGVGTTVRVLIPLDGPARIEHSSLSTPTVVALAHARKKSHTSSTADDEARRTA